jgi:outer membrane protein assembly factor BamA
VVATALAARAVVARTTAQLTQLSGSVNGGMLSGTGTVAFAPNSPLEGTLALTVDGMAIEFPEGLRSELSAALGISVLVPVTDTAAPTGSVKGTVTVLRSAYREPLAVVTGVLNALRTRRLAAEAGAAEPSLIDNLVLDVRVLTDEDIVVDNNLGRLQLGTDLRVIGTVAAPSVAGRAQLREGGRLYFGRNIYVIESGTIDFANPVTVEPDVSIRARTRAGGEDIVLTLKGTPETLETDLEAPDSPELGEADLYSLLLTGRRLDEVSGDEAQIVGEQVLGYLSGDVLGFAGRAVGLDTIRLGGIDEDVLRRDPTAVATELDPTTRLTFGKSFGRDFDLTYSQSLRDSDAQAWILDYRPFRAVETRFVSDDDNLRSYEVRHDVSIGGGSLSDRPTRATTAPRPELRVTGVAVRGGGPIPERRVTSALRLKAGDTFDFGEWQLDRERLEALYHGEAYYEARINAQRSENGNAVALDYEVAPGPHGRVEVTGLRLGEDTMDRIRTAWSQSVVDAFLVDEVQEIVAGDLAREGYLQARVEVSFRLKAEATGEDSFTGGFRRQPEDPEEKTLSITIEPGPRATAYHVTIDAPDPGLVEELTEIVRDRRLDRMASTDSAAVQRELTAHLRAGGYLQARVSVRPPTLEAGQAQIRVNVDPGRRFTIADIVFAGASRVPTQTLLSESNLVPGAPFDPAAVDAARGRIVAWYRREGFARATVGVRQVPREDVAGIAVAFDIDEGPRQVVAEIDVQGSRGVDADVVTRALDLQVNQPLAANAWLDARRRVFDTGLFRRVDVAAEEIGAAPPGADMQPMRVRVNVQPWPALRLRYGFQVAEQRPEGEVEGRELVPGLAADLTRRTLFGRAVTLGAAIEYDRREQAGRAFLSAPTMFGWPIESLVVLERSRETFTADTLTTDRTGVALEQRFRLVPDLRLSVTYRFERDHTFDTGEPDPIVGPRDITVRVARLNASAAFDTRNDPVDATRGMLLSSSFDYAPAALGTEFRFVKHLAQAYYFRQWRRLVFASAARFGVAGALDDQVLLLSERFTAGGAHSVRGAAEDGLGPRDFFGATGGEAVVVLNQEVRFPIYRWLRGVGFVDAGNVFERRSDIDLGALVGSAGFGLRLETPFALLRVDYGRLFSPGPGTGRSGRWMFGIGQAF